MSREEAIQNMKRIRKEVVVRANKETRKHRNLQGPKPKDVDKRIFNLDTKKGRAV